MANETTEERTPKDQERMVESLFDRAAAMGERGRYIILGTLGRGGMGTVLRAYDRELDRRVALKVLHRDLDARHTQRLRREAKALAKLSHPNVVQVYEVGELAGQSFVVMELVEGMTVGEWMKQEPRPDWRACVQLFIELGAGLAVAHGQGLVHRDFKPGNAIIGADGRSRVLDFGLARQADDIETLERDDRSPTDVHEPISSDVSLTKTGAVLGTPAYMPLEQMTGLNADARSDQFSFCVSLYEAVHGERPYEGSSLPALMVSMKGGILRPAPKGRTVPLALRKVLLRGLATSPEQRWPSMDALLRELRKLVAPRRKRWLALGITVGLVAVGAGLGMDRYAKWANRCTGAQRQLDGVWDEARKQEIREALLGTDLPSAPRIWEDVAQHLDTYAEAWATQHTEACEATRVTEEQNEAVLALRMRCLHERTVALRAAVDVLGKADANVTVEAVGLVVGLPELERCEDVGWLEEQNQRVPPPGDPRLAQEVQAQRELLLEVEAHRRAGVRDTERDIAEQVTERAKALGYSPLLAEALLHRGSARLSWGELAEAERDLGVAFELAAEHDHTVVMTRALSLLIRVSKFMRRNEQALWWGKVALPFARRPEVGPSTEALVHEQIGSVLLGQDKLDEAQRHHQQALTIRERVLGSDNPDIASSLKNLGLIAVWRGEHEEALSLLRRALSIYEAALGDEHPDVTSMLINIGGILSILGRHEESLPYLQRAVSNSKSTWGKDDPIQVTTTLANLANTQSAMGELEDAQASWEEALSIYEHKRGPNSFEVAMALNNLGGVLREQGKLEQAQIRQQRALAVFEQASGPDDPDVAFALVELAELALALQEPGAARTYAERALSIREAAKTSQRLLAETRFLMARTLEGDPDRRQHARMLAEQARDFHANADPPAEDEVARVQAWLDEHPE